MSCIKQKRVKKNDVTNFSQNVKTEEKKEKKKTRKKEKQKKRKRKKKEEKKKKKYCFSLEIQKEITKFEKFEQRNYLSKKGTNPRGRFVSKGPYK